jgi:hypothetical protein
VNGGTPVPYDADLEEAVLGALLVPFVSVGDVADLLDPSDLYVIAHQHVYAAILTLHEQGQRSDAITVRAELLRRGHDGLDETIIHCQAAASINAVHNASILADLAQTRRVLAVTTEVTALIQAGKLTGQNALDAALKGLASIKPLDRGTRTERLTDSDVMIEDREVRSTKKPWVIPGLLRRDWRCIIVAPEGAGKSWVLRQLAVCGGGGVHPFDRHTLIPPIKTLLIDLENPDDVIIDSLDIIRTPVMASNEDYQKHQCFVLPLAEGIDLRSAVDQRYMEEVFTIVSPDLVCLGPLYKAFSTKANEDHEQPASEVQRVLDDFRTRHGFALVMEHHAPKGAAGSREMIPFGSSLWLRWPELGLTLEPPSKNGGRGRGGGKSFGTLKVGEFRAPRVNSGWPGTIERDLPPGLPWRSVDPGTIHNAGESQ